MANIKVSELSETTTFDDNDYTMIIQGNENKKITKENMLNGFALNGNLLWTNPSPTSDFSAQEITLSSDDYDYLIIFWLNYKASNRLSNTFTLKNYGAYLNLASDYTTGDSIYYVASYVREITRNSDTSFSINNCYVKYDNSISRPTSNGNIIPLYIIGYKTGMFN